MTRLLGGCPAAAPALRTDQLWLGALFEASPVRDGETVLRVSGALDAAAAPRFRDRLDNTIEATTADVVVDLAGVRFIDSRGLAVLVQAHQRLEATARTLLIACPSRSITRILEITGLEALLATQANAHGASADGAAAPATPSCPPPASDQAASSSPSSAARSPSAA